jgi:hypothetical protein
MDKKTFLVNCDRAVEYLNSLERSSDVSDTWPVSYFSNCLFCILWKNCLPVNAFFHVLICNYHFFYPFQYSIPLGSFCCSFTIFTQCGFARTTRCLSMISSWTGIRRIAFKVCIISAWAYHLLFMHNMWVKFKLKLPLLKTLLQNCFRIASLA